MGCRIPGHCTVARRGRRIAHRAGASGASSHTLRVRHDGRVLKTIPNKIVFAGEEQHKHAIDACLHPAPRRRGRPSSWKIVLTAAVLGTLLALQRKSTAPAGVVRRARAILLLADGESKRWHSGESRPVTSARPQVGPAVPSARSARTGGEAATGPNSKVLSRCRSVLGQDGVRDARSAGTEPVAVGL
jgi:hypothetical protein